MIDKGVLLVNLGTPNSAEVRDVKSYLREFLIDKRVVDLAFPLRYLLVNAFIVPFRAKKSAKAYQSIWNSEGSPLLHLSQHFASQLKSSLSDYQIALGMRYGKPSLYEALDHLKQCKTITILPLYPQYSSAATGSCLEEVMRLIQSWEVIPNLKLIRDFHKEPYYISAQAEIIKAHLTCDTHLVFSYHGIPVRQITKSGCKPICIADCPDFKNPGCYKAQCEKTSFLLAKQLALDSDQYSIAFQSRLGKTPWIKPYLDELLVDLSQKGIKNIAVACPSFVTDCLETLEEIGIRAKNQWKALGGENFQLVPSLNSSPLWIKAVVDLIRKV